MTIFSRRVIQSLLDENRNFLTDDQVGKHIVNLNKQDDNVIATVWEVVILNALSKTGLVKHEMEFEGASKPDIYFESNEVRFVADVTTISDDNYNDDNPIRYFKECLNRFMSKEGITTKGISIRIDSKKIGKYSDFKVRLALPDKKNIPEFIKNEFYTIRQKIKTFPEIGFSHEINSEESSVSLSYTPNSSGASLSHAAYTVPYSLTKNPIYNRLKKKADQLRKSKYEGVMGVFACDGESDSLNNDFHSLGKYSQNDIVSEIFRINKTLSFVVIITPEDKRDPLSFESEKYIKSVYYANPNAKFRVQDQLFNILEKLTAHFPLPENMAINARIRLKTNRNEGLSFNGGYKMSGNKISISSRVLVRLLAGELSYEEFDRDHISSGDNRNLVKDFFLSQVSQGKMLENIVVEKCPDKDDDWINFEFGNVDAAISKYR